MVKNAITVFARVKPENNRRGVVDYKIHRRPKKHFNEDFLVLTSHQKFAEYIDNRPESWNFSFSRIFGYDVSQDDVFDSVARPIVNRVFEGYNATIFAYGQTGSGKTYTITGEPEINAERGILPRTLQYVFDTIQKNPENIYSVEIAYLEIYNENGYDLLLERKQRESASRLEDLPRVTIQEDENGTMHLKNLSFRTVENANEALQFLVDGDMYRAISETPMNPRSSRSHCIFTIVVSIKKFGTEHYIRSKMHLVDLAGSERVYKCSIQGTILTEAKHINLSLHFLEQVIVSLGQGNASHVPYRNSLLTSILRDSIGGNCLTTMLATISVSTFNLEETISTCRFAQRVALVRNDVNLSFELDAKSENTLLKMENERLRKEIEELKKRTIEMSCSNLLPGNLEYYKNLVVQRDQEISHLIDLLRKERSRKKSSTKDIFSEDFLKDRKFLKLSPRNIGQNLQTKLTKQREKTSPKRNENRSPKIERNNQCQYRTPISLEIPMLNLEDDFIDDQNFDSISNSPIGSNIANKINTKTESKETFSESLNQKTELEHFSNSKMTKMPIDLNFSEKIGNQKEIIGSKNFIQREIENSNKKNVSKNPKESKEIADFRNKKIPIVANLTKKIEIKERIDSKTENIETIPLESFHRRECKKINTEHFSITDHKKTKTDTELSMSQKLPIEINFSENIERKIERSQTIPAENLHKREAKQTITEFSNVTDHKEQEDETELSITSEIFQLDESKSKNNERNQETDFIPIFTDEVQQSDKKSVKKSAREREKSPNFSFPKNVTTMMKSPKSVRQNNESFGICSPKSVTPTTGFKTSNIFRSMLCKEKMPSTESSTCLEENNESTRSKKEENDWNIVKGFDKKSLPLTGDPEIDEEIIAFYKAKRSGGIY